MIPDIWRAISPLCISTSLNPDMKKLTALKDHYQRGGLGDGTIKQRLFEVLNEFLSPIRKKREELAKDKGEILSLLKGGTERAREVTERTLQEVKSAMKIDFSW